MTQDKGSTFSFNHVYIHMLLDGADTGVPKDLIAPPGKDGNLSVVLKSEHIRKGQEESDHSQRICGGRTSIKLELPSKR